MYEQASTKQLIAFSFENCDFSSVLAMKKKTYMKEQRSS